MNHLGIIVSRKRKTSFAVSSYECPVFSYPELTLKDMTEFKNRLYAALETDQAFMEYNGRKYSREFAKFAVKVTENKRDRK